MSKYAALPDIDDQPDVYETDDITDDKTAALHNDDDEASAHGQSNDENESVVRSRVSVKDASSRFKDTVVDASHTDFSDRLTRRKKSMYRTFVRRPPALETDEYEILPKEMILEETRLQKLRRLMYEVQELNQEIDNDKVKKKKDPLEMTRCSSNFSRKTRARTRAMYRRPTC
ncbi:Dynamitin-domain-containing protein [Gongronella butleri]|nr:Dynamitin-domain-containing protein [Gongronella butleri]